MNFDVNAVPSPSYVVEESLLRKNLEILKSVIDRTGCKILLAQKGFSMYSVYPLIGDYLDGVTSSSLNEARLGREEMGKEVHKYARAFSDAEIYEILRLSDHIVFNSLHQWNIHKEKVQNHSRKIEVRLRIDPEYSEIEVHMYKPGFAYSRFGITLGNVDASQLDGREGFHVHT